MPVLSCAPAPLQPTPRYSPQWPKGSHSAPWLQKEETLVSWSLPGLLLIKTRLSASFSFRVSVSAEHSQACFNVLMNPNTFVFIILPNALQQTKPSYPILKRWPRMRSLPQQTFLGPYLITDWEAGILRKKRQRSFCHLYILT